MKKEIHHICITSHSEIMFRSEADMHYAFNCLAAACVRTDSKLLAFSLLTSHMHIAVITDSPEKMSPVIHKLSDNKADTTRGNSSVKL